MKAGKKTKRKNTGSALLTSVMSLVVCCALLIGATFAWFSDSVSSGKNKITAGNLEISAAYRNVDMENGSISYQVPGFERTADGTVKFSEEEIAVNEKTPIISEDTWEPGAVGAKLLFVKNDGSLAAKVKLSFLVQDAGLQDALWFDFVQVKDSAVIGQFQQREMSMLSDFCERIELPLMPKGEAGDSISFILFYGMKEEAGNQYQGKNFSADVSILATQYSYEEDSFGKDYDETAAWPVVRVTGSDNIADIIKELPSNTAVRMEEDITLPAGGNIVVEEQKDLALYLNGNTLKLEQTGMRPVEVKTGASLRILGSGGEVCTNRATYCIENRGALLLEDVRLSNENTGGNTIHNYGTLSLRNSEVKGVNYGIYNYGANAVIEEIDNCRIETTGDNSQTIRNFGGVIKAIRQTSAVNSGGGSFGSIALYSEPLSDGSGGVVERIEEGEFAGEIQAKKGKVTIYSGRFAGIGLTPENFNKYVAAGHSAEEKDGVFTVK